MSVSKDDIEFVIIRTTETTLRLLSHCNDMGVAMVNCFYVENKLVKGQTTVVIESKDIYLEHRIFIECKFNDMF